MIPDLDEFGEGAERKAIVPFPCLVFLEAGLALLAVLIGWGVGCHPLAGFEWTDRGVIDGLIATLPLIGWLWLSHRWPASPILKLKAFLRREILPYLQGANRLDLAMLSLSAGIGEELLFRGLLQQGLENTLGVVPALVIASVLFGLFHPASLIYVVVATILGGYLGIVWLVSGNLLAVIVAHAVYDFVALVVLTEDDADDTGIE